jgi:sugar phosphate isomerase/epimerase
MYSLVELYRNRPGVAAFLRQAKEWQLEGVELLDFFWQDKDRELKEAIALKEELGIEVYSYSISNNFVEPDPVKRTEQLEKIADAVETAGRLGAKVIRVFCGDSKEGISFEQASSWIAEGLTAGTALAESAGLTLALENHGLFAGRAEQVSRIIAQVGSDALRATLDTGNFLLVDEDPVESVRRLAAQAALVHFKDFKAVGPEATERVYLSKAGKRYQGTVIGQGDVDLPAIVSLLKDSGYQGFLSIEFEGAGPALASVEESIKYVKRIIG